MEQSELKKRPTALRARVRTLEGKILKNTRVYFVESPVEMPDIAALTNDEGEVVMAAPRSGFYRLGFSLNGYKNRIVEVTVNDESEIQLEVNIEPED